MQTNRRQFLNRLSGVAATSAVPQWLPMAQAAITGTNTQLASVSDFTLWQQAWNNRFTNVLPNPLAAGFILKPASGTTYTVTAGQTAQNLLGVPGVTTTVWGYRGTSNAISYPGPTFEVTQGSPITVRWVNGLVDAANKPLPHLLPIDQTIAIQTPTTGVPLAVHHHGGDTAFEFDGGPDQWQTPVRKQSGPGVLVGSKTTNGKVQVGTVGALTYVYDNAQEASMHWYHDHAESITGINVNAGLAGLYVVRDKNETALRSSRILPPAADEVALVIQDRTVDARGQLVYGMGSNPASPSHQPEEFGDIMVVNGVAWPVMTVGIRKYRTRLLNGTDSRFLTLTLSSPLVTMWVIGNDLGLLNKPVVVPATGLTMGPAERYDVIMDFSNVPATVTSVDLLNSAVTPFPTGGAPGAGTATVMQFKVVPGTPTVTSTTTKTSKATTVVQTTVAPTPGGTTTTVTTTVTPISYSKSSTTNKPTITVTKSTVLSCVMTTASALRGANSTTALATAAAPAGATTRRILLGEGVDTYGRVLPMLGVYDPTGVKNTGTLSFQDPATETPKLGSTEIWEFWNATGDAHPMHMHLVKFRVLNRQDIDPLTMTVATTTMANGAQGVKLNPGSVLGAITAPGPWEAGYKDTVVCPPNQVTRIVVNFNRVGKYVYHCHILSHEDHDMMRWYQVI